MTYIKLCVKLLNSNSMYFNNAEFMKIRNFVQKLLIYQIVFINIYIYNYMYMIYKVKCILFFYYIHIII